MSEPLIGWPRPPVPRPQRAHAAPRQHELRRLRHVDRPQHAEPRGRRHADPDRDPGLLRHRHPRPLPELGLRRAGGRFDLRLGGRVATGLAHVARLNDEPTRVVCWAGDGGTYDIGMATLSAAAERDEDILYICYDNEIYGNTGGQRSSATPLGAVTTTTPSGQEHRQEGHPVDHGRAPRALRRLDLAGPSRGCAAQDAHRPGTPGFAFLHILSPCPTGWKSEPADGIELIRLAVQLGSLPRGRDPQRPHPHHRRRAGLLRTTPWPPTSNSRAASAKRASTWTKCAPLSARPGRGWSASNRKESSHDRQ